MRRQALIVSTGFELTGTEKALPSILVSLSAAQRRKCLDPGHGGGGRVEPRQG